MPCAGGDRRGPYDWDIEKNEVLYSPGVRRQILVPEAELRTPQDWIDRIHATTCRPSRNARASICVAPRRASNARSATGRATEAGAGRASTASPCATPSGRAVRLVGSTGDITDNKRLAEALAQAEARLKAAVEAASEGFVVWDEHDRLVMCNSVYRNFFRGRRASRRSRAWPSRPSCAPASRSACSPRPARISRLGTRPAAASAYLCRPTRAAPVRRPVADRQRPAVGERRRGLGLHRHHRAQAPRTRAGGGGRPLALARDEAARAAASSPRRSRRSRKASPCSTAPTG